MCSGTDRDTFGPDGIRVDTASMRSETLLERPKEFEPQIPS